LPPWSSTDADGLGAVVGRALREGLVLGRGLAFLLVVGDGSAEWSRRPRLRSGEADGRSSRCVASADGVGCARLVRDGDGDGSSLCSGSSKSAGVITRASEGIDTGTLWANDSLPRRPVSAGAAATVIAAATTIRRRRAGPLGIEGMGQLSRNGGWCRHHTLVVLPLGKDPSGLQGRRQGRVKTARSPWPGPPSVQT